MLARFLCKVIRLHSAHSQLPVTVVIARHRAATCSHLAIATVVHCHCCPPPHGAHGAPLLSLPPSLPACSAPCFHCCPPPCRSYLDINSFRSMDAVRRDRQRDMETFADSLRAAMLLSLACCAVLQASAEWQWV